jgi:hypothetical protein
MIGNGDDPATLADVIDYNRNKLAPQRVDPRAGDHWFDDVKGGFDTLWCAVARLELMIHCGMTSQQVGGPVLVDCKNKDKIAEQLSKKCPEVEDDPAVLQMLFIKKPPPGATPWGD